MTRCEYGRSRTQNHPPTTKRCKTILVNNFNAGKAYVLLSSAYYRANRSNIRRTLDTTDNQSQKSKDYKGNVCYHSWYKSLWCQLTCIMSVDKRKTKRPLTNLANKSFHEWPDGPVIDHLGLSTKSLNYEEKLFWYLRQPIIDKHLKKLHREELKPNGSFRKWISTVTALCKHYMESTIAPWHANKGTRLCLERNYFETTSSRILDWQSIPVPRWQNTC